MSGPRRAHCRLAALGIGLVALAALGVPAAAEVRRVELSVLAVDDAGALRPRAQLVDEAVSEAVLRVARALVEPGAGPAPEDVPGWLQLLGGAERFATRVREITAADVPSGMLLSRMAVEVDADGVASALRDAGLPLREGQSQPEEAFRIQLDARDWRVVSRLETALATRWGAESVPERLLPGRVWLRVTAPGGPEALVERMQREPEEGLEVTPLGLDAGTLVLDVAVLEPAPDSGTFDTAE